MKSEYKALILFSALSAVLALLINLAFGFLSSIVTNIPEFSAVLNPETTFTFLNALFIAMGVSLLIVMIIYRIFHALLALLVYLIVQVACSLVTPLFISFDSLTTYNAEFGNAMSWTLIISSLLTIPVLHAVKLINVKNPGIAQLTFRPTTYFILAAILLMFASNLLSEWMKLENNMAEQFLAMATTIPGMLAIGIVGPITEEYVFREAIQGSMLRQGRSPWFACFVSALIFGLIHGNPVQIPFAFMVGLVFAVIYYRTRSIIPVAICHIVNNSCSVILMNIYSDNPDIGFKDIIGSETAVLICFAASLTVGMLMLVSLCRKK